MDDAIECIGASAYSSTGSKCLDQIHDRLSFINTFRVIWKEPVVMVRMLKYVFSNMQDVSLDYLGRYSIDDPRNNSFTHISEGIETRYRASGRGSPILNLWASIKYKCFPRGVALIIVLIIFIIGFSLKLRRSNLHQSISLVGLLATVACITDMTITILGDGKYELIKHLFMSNILFDIAALAFLNNVLICDHRSIVKKFSISIFGKFKEKVNLK